MWAVHKKDGTIAGTHGTLQRDADGKPRLLPVDDDGETYLMPQVEITEAQYAAWKASRPPPPPPRDLAAEVDELKAKLAALEPKTTSGAKR